MSDQGSFGALLRELRLTAGLTQEELSARSGVSVRSISDLERCRTRRPFARSVELLADALKVGEQPREALHEAARLAAREQREQTADRPASPAPVEVPAGCWPMCQLPPVVADFTGRDAECERIRGVLAQDRDDYAVPVVVLSGAPGMGKTTLALRVAHSLRSAFPDGQLYTQLAGASCHPRDAGDVLGEVLRALGVAPAAIPESVDQRAALYRSRLADRRVLVVADDVGSPRQVEPLLPGTPGCAVIVTSRNSLAGLSGASPVALDSFTHAEAVELLGRIAGAHRVAAEQGAADRLVEACGRLPLAVRIAGAKLASRPGWPLARVAELVADERCRLDELAVADLAMRSCVAPSYELLDGRARCGFRRLSVLGPVDVAEWVIAALIGEPDAADVVDVLVDRSLLIPVGVDATGEPRYRLHDLLRDYAAERVADEPQAERDAAMERVLAAYLELAALADRNLPGLGFFPPGQPRAVREVGPSHPTAHLTLDPLDWFSAERLNVISIISWACANDLHQEAARLAVCHRTFHLYQYRVDDAEQIWRMIGRACERAGDLATSCEARFYLAWVMADSGRFADAHAALDTCIPLLEAREAHGTVAAAVYWRAFCAEGLGRYEMQRDDALHALGLARLLKDPGLEVSSLRLLGLALARLGRHDRGVELCEQAVQIARNMHEVGWEYEGLTALTFALCLAGRYPLAEHWCRTGIEVSRRLGTYARGQAFLLGMLGDSCIGQGRYQEGIRALEQAMATFEEHRDRRGEALCLLKQGQAYLALGQNQPALGLLQRCFPIFQELGLPAYEDATVRALEECRTADDSHLGRNKL